MASVADVPKSIPPATVAAMKNPVVKAATTILNQEQLLASLNSIPTLLDTSNDEVEHILLYGEPGTGKTNQAGLLAEFFNVLWFDGDKGLTTIINSLPPELQKRIHVIKIPDNTMYPIMISTMLKVITGRQINICTEHGVVDCSDCAKNNLTRIDIALNQLPKNWVVVMDSQTQLVASGLALSYWKLNPAGIGKEDINDYWRGTGDDVFAYWGGLKNVMDKFGSYVKDLQCQFVSISHETMVKMEDNVTLNIAPVAGSDNSSRGYAKYYGTQVHCRKVNGAMTYTTGAVASNRIQTKSRSGIMLEKKKTPALLHIFKPQEAEELLKGSYTEWYFIEGWKDKADRKLIVPKPKEVLPI